MSCYDRYPTSIVALNLSEVTAALLVGAVIIAPFGWWAVAAYAAVGLTAAILSVASGCTRCHYYDQVCGSGLGKVAAMFFSERSEEEFGRTRSQMLAWTLVGITLLVPLAGGLFALARDSSVPTVIALSTFVGLLIGLMITHARLVCNHCHEGRNKRCTLGWLRKSL